MNATKALETFLLECEMKGLTVATLKTYKLELTRLLRDLPEDLTEATSEDVKRHIVARKSTHKQSSINSTIRTGKAFFAFLTTFNALTNDPMDGVKLIRHQTTVGRTADRDEVDAILNDLKPTDFASLRDRLSITLLADTGGRVAEVCALTLADVDLKAKTVAFNRTKNGKARTVPMTNRLHAELVRYMDARPSTTCASLLLNARKQPLSTRSVQQSLKYHSRDELTPHTLRRGFAKRLVQNGVDVFTAAALTGHQDIKVLQRYVATYGEDKTKAIASIE